MKNWTNKKGYPVVQITRNGNNQLSLSQRWFLLISSKKISSNLTEYNSYKWWIPVSLTSSDELDFNFEKRPIWLDPAVEISILHLYLQFVI
jgi:aminopeptidase N